MGSLTAAGGGRRRARSTPYGYIRDLDRGRYFQTVGLSDEDRGRSEMYRQSDRERGASHRVWIAGRVPRAARHARVSRQHHDREHRPSHTAGQKTNQFNLTTRRYTDSQIARLAADQAGWARAFRLADRFGTTVSSACSSASPLRVTAGDRSWLMSCRVLGRAWSTSCSITCPKPRARRDHLDRGRVSANGKEHAGRRSLDASGVSSDGRRAGRSALRLRHRVQRVRARRTGLDESPYPIGTAAR